MLDDNKKLCLVSGEIIQLSSTMTMMFEVEDLAVASPATVSRCGMVYMEPTAMGLDPLLESWLQALPKPCQPFGEKLRALFEKLVAPTLRLVRKSLRETVATTSNNLVLSLFKLMDSLLLPWRRQENEPKLSEEEIAKLPNVIEQLFLFSIVWSIGASCDNDGRVKFDRALRDACSEAGVDKIPPGERDVYAYCFDQDTCQWVDWMATIPEFKCDPDRPFSEIIVPTSDTVRYTYVIDQLLRNNCHVLCVGETGTGKTLNVADKLLNKMGAETVPLFLTFSARTSANQTQDLIDSKMEKRRKGVFGPPSGKKYVVFVDDMNMPQREKYFAQPPIEILRQWMDHKGW